MPDERELRRLLDEERVSEVVALVSGEDVGLAWCRYATRAVKMEEHPEWDADPDGWAAGVVHECDFYSNEELVRRFLLAVADAAPSDRVLGWFGAGPLEEFAATDDERRLGWIEQKAASSEKFRAALANAWVRGKVSAESLRRLEKAAGVSLK